MQDISTRLGNGRVSFSWLTDNTTNVAYLALQIDGKPDAARIYHGAKIPFGFGIDANGNYGYIKGGADTVTPFRSGFTTLSALFQHYYTQNQNKTYTATKDCTVLVICLQTTHGGDGCGGYKSTLSTTGEILSSNKYRKQGYMDGTFRAVDMDVALIKLINGNNIKMVTPACANACTIMQVFELS